MSQTKARYDSIWNGITRLLAAVGIGFSVKHITDPFPGTGPDLELKLPSGTVTAATHERKCRNGFRTLERWLVTRQLLILKRGRRKPFVVMPFDVFADLIAAADVGSMGKLATEAAEQESP
jgi:hypothetical protein